MADPISMDGTGGVVGGIIDVTDRAIHTLGELRNRWKEPGLGVSSLVVQLAALRAALKEIKGLADNDLGDLHSQLVMDLDTSLSYCGMLIDIIDMLLSELYQAANGTLDFSSEVKVVFGSESFDKVQKLVEKQTDALTLLLSCN
jgi:guanine nucleotide-binding protein G(i) subunit alpha